MKDPRDVIIKPVVSEKSYGLIDSGAYTFIVAPGSNKTEIKLAVEAIFNVKVAKVNTLIREGKSHRNRKTGATGKKSDSKRAVVTLKGDDRIPMFEN